MPEDKDFTNKLILGDNLEALKGIEDNSIDLIYLDPPFFSNKTYEVIWGDEGEVRSFEDRFEGGIEHYIGWLYERVRLMYDKLKPTGSMFLHCDWHASANIRVEILDKIFGRNNFRNEIVWHYRRWTAPSNNLQKLHDMIFWYSKSDNYTFNPLFTDYTDGSVSRKKSGKLHRFKKGEEPLLVSDKTIDEKGVRENDVWQIPFIAPSAKERIGYPTQKPELLLERIIELASNEGDTVLDPFVGGGTTIAVADKLGRKWIGIDQSSMAIKVSDLRLKKQHDAFSQPYELILRKYDYDILRSSNAFEFESWIINKFGGIPNAKQRNDFGLDGRMSDNTPIQVKRSDNIGRNVVDNFLSAIRRQDEKLFEKNKKDGKIAGYIIAFSFGKGAVEEIARLKNKNSTIIKLVKVSDIVDYGKKPEVSLSADSIDKNEFEFTAKAKSEPGIDFYAWDFSHSEQNGFKPDVLFDKTGKQTKKFPDGEHQIAVEAVDREGISGTDKVKIEIKNQKK
ncbi:MAG: site-specific DNA-methyltransferase [Dysgonamonadaceae bacterium]|jgi:DNA modification methylase|nr:site-specific DNA-methyltransferase [Dysgonamonadaceae bacterium]